MANNNDSSDFLSRLNYCWENRPDAIERCVRARAENFDEYYDSRDGDNGFLWLLKASHCRANYTDLKLHLDEFASGLYGLTYPDEWNECDEKARSGMRTYVSICLGRRRLNGEGELTLIFEDEGAKAFFRDMELRRILRKDEPKPTDREKLVFRATMETERVLENVERERRQVVALTKQIADLNESIAEQTKLYCSVEDVIARKSDDDAERVQTEHAEWVIAMGEKRRLDQSSVYDDPLPPSKRRKPSSPDDDE